MKVSKIILAIAAVVAVAMPMKAQSAEEGWTKIEPTELKNAISLFDEDWFALAAGKQGDMNAMTISWGGIGELWGKPVVTVYVRKSRHTHKFMELYPYFTLTAFPESKRDALQYIGSHSGSKEKDKIAKAGLTPEFTALGNPVFKEGNLAIECRIIYEAPLELDGMLDDEVIKDYKETPDYHTMYIGEIVNVWKR